MDTQERQASVYVETTIPSLLAARPSRDLLTAAHQQSTHDWWETARRRYALFVSEAVLDEVARGDPALAERRLRLVEDLPILSLNDDVRQLTIAYERELGLGAGSSADVGHIAFAVSYEMDYLVTWNCSHIANAHVVRRLRRANQRLGRETPVIATPEELLEP